MPEIKETPAKVNKPKWYFEALQKAEKWLDDHTGGSYFHNYTISEKTRVVQAWTAIPKDSTTREPKVIIFVIHKAGSIKRFEQIEGDYIA